MGWFGSILGSAADWLGGILGNEYASKQANERYKETEEYLALNKPSWQVQGLRDAGLNPILAVTGGSLGSSSAVNTASSVQNKPSFRDALTTAKSLELLDSQKDKLDAETLQHTNSARLLDEQRKQIRRENEFFNKNPNVYALGQGNKAMPGVGGVAMAINQAVNDLSNSAKSWENEKRASATVKRKVYDFAQESY